MGDTMNLTKAIKFVLMSLIVVYFFPSFNGLITFILKFFLYLLLILLANLIIDEGIILFNKNSRNFYLRYIDEREHIRGNTLGELKKLDFLGTIFRIWHYVGFNKKRIIHEMWSNCLENLAVIIITILFFVTVIGFIIVGIVFY